MEGQLCAALAKCSCETLHEEQCEKPDIVFCGDSLPALAGALARWPGVPAVVASWLPDVDRWIDALEAGAADYCAPPFEPSHLRWLLDTHAGAHPRPSIAGAAA
jgi:DNA-binding response OmpR family regulator